jgi:hypothetical protein
MFVPNCTPPSQLLELKDGMVTIEIRVIGQGRDFGKQIARAVPTSPHNCGEGTRSGSVCLRR